MAKKLFLLTVIWPVVHLAIYLIRFGEIDSTILLQSSYFLPLGLLSGVILLKFLDKGTPVQKRGVVIGFILTIPFALVGSLMGGLIFQPVVGATIFGLVPLSMGMVIGFYLPKALKVK